MTRHNHDPTVSTIGRPTDCGRRSGSSRTVPLDRSEVNEGAGTERVRTGFGSLWGTSSFNQTDVTEESGVVPLTDGRPTRPFLSHQTGPGASPESSVLS